MESYEASIFHSKVGASMGDSGLLIAAGVLGFGTRVFC